MITTASTMPSRTTGSGKGSSGGLGLATHGDPAYQRVANTIAPTAQGINQLIPYLETTGPRRPGRGGTRQEAGAGSHRPRGGGRGQPHRSPPRWPLPGRIQDPRTGAGGAAGAAGRAGGRATPAEEETGAAAPGRGGGEARGRDDTGAALGGAGAAAGVREAVGAAGRGAAGRGAAGRAGVVGVAPAPGVGVEGEGGGAGGSVSFLEWASERKCAASFILASPAQGEAACHLQRVQTARYRAPDLQTATGGLEHSEAPGGKPPGAGGGQAQ